MAQPGGGQGCARSEIVRHGLFGRLCKAAERACKADQRQQHQRGIDVVAVYAQGELRPACGQPQDGQKHKPARGISAEKRLHASQQHKAGRGIQQLAAHDEVHVQHIQKGQPQGKKAMLAQCEVAVFPQPVPRADAARHLEHQRVVNGGGLRHRLKQLLAAQKQLYGHSRQCQHPQQPGADIAL